MVPVSFDDCIGWLHEGQFGPDNSARGVVLMNPFGFEELCSRKAFVLLAQALSARGIPVLRFDWSAAGDSLGGPFDSRQVERWRANAHAAIETLKRHAGVSEVVLVGMRLGGLLAAEAASARTDVSRLVLIAPPASGKAWLREISAFARLMASPDVSAKSFDGLECAGFRLSKETVDDIKQLNWSNLTACPAPQVDIFAARSPAQDDPLPQQLQALGASISNGIFAGYDSLMCDPTASEVPLGTLTALAARIADKAPVSERVAEPHAFTPISGYGFSEMPARIGEKTVMAGIFCNPLERTERSEAVILLNAGAIHHGGWGRMHVDLARRLARHGIASLRLDLPGIGDSASLSDPQVASLYSRKMTSEVTQAIGWLKDRGYRRITLAGACSGAYQAFHAAIADERVDQLVLLNQLCFVWGKSYSIQFNAWQATKSRAMQVQLAGDDSENSLAAARSLARLLPIARKAAKTSISALMSLQTMAANALARENPVEAAFANLSARGTRILLAFSEGDAGLSELERHLGPEGENATSLPGVEKIIIENADHLLTSVQSREVYGDRLVAFLDASQTQTLTRDRPLWETVSAGAA